MVEALGPDTSGRLTKGQRVVAADWGEATYQEFVAVDEKHLVLCTVLDDLGVSCLSTIDVACWQCGQRSRRALCDSICAGLSPAMAPQKALTTDGCLGAGRCARSHKLRVFGADLHSHHDGGRVSGGRCSAEGELDQTQNGVQVHWTRSSCVRDQA